MSVVVAAAVAQMEPAQDPRTEVQAIGRAQRLGQNKGVTVTRMQMRGTYEEAWARFMAQRCGGEGGLGTQHRHCRRSPVICIPASVPP